MSSNQSRATNHHRDLAADSVDLWLVRCLFDFAFIYFLLRVLCVILGLSWRCLDVCFWCFFQYVLGMFMQYGWFSLGFIEGRFVAYSRLLRRSMDEDQDEEGKVIVPGSVGLTQGPRGDQRG